jgi:BMFP domain-containing protein YqiC
MAFGIETVKSIIRVSLAAGQVVPFYLNLLASDPGKSYLRPIWPLYEAVHFSGPTAARRPTMSTGPNRILDEFAKLMTDAAGAAQGVRREIETAVNAQAERWLNSLDIVKREEFEAVREMAIKARDENEALLARIEALEARLSSEGK